MIEKKLTDKWKNSGVAEVVEFAILTNDIYKEWSGMPLKNINNMWMNLNK